VGCYATGPYAFSTNVLIFCGNLLSSKEKKELRNFHSYLQQLFFIDDLFTEKLVMCMEVHNG